jgi:hypothetical protein
MHMHMHRHHVHVHMYHTHTQRVPIKAVEERIAARLASLIRAASAPTWGERLEKQVRSPFT